jgi:hypothetical protein
MIRKKTTILTLQEKRARGEPISMVTAYDYPSALAADRAGMALYSVQRHGHRLRASLRQCVRRVREEGARTYRIRVVKVQRAR